MSSSINNWSWLLIIASCKRIASCQHVRFSRTDVGYVSFPLASPVSNFSRYKKNSSPKYRLRKCRLSGFQGLLECTIPGSIILTQPGCRMVVQPFRLYCSPPSELSHRTCPLWMWLVNTKLFAHESASIPGDNGDLY